MLKDIKGVIFDYGGTIDTNSCPPPAWLGRQNKSHHPPLGRGFVE